MTNIIKKTREYFCKEIRGAVKQCQQSVILKFLDSLWAENRVTITKELLERFGELRVKTSGNYVTTAKVSEIKDIPINIVDIEIEFVNEF